MWASAISGHWLSAIAIARRISPVATSRCTTTSYDLLEQPADLTIAP